MHVSIEIEILIKTHNIMNLKQLNRETVKSIRRGKLSLMISKVGSFTFSKNAVKNLLLQDGDYIELIQDVDNPKDFYLTKSNEKNGYKLRRYYSLNSAISFNSSAIASLIFKSLHISGKNAISCLISPEPIIENGNKIWAIITSSAQ